MATLLKQAEVVNKIIELKRNHRYQVPIPQIPHKSKLQGYSRAFLKNRYQVGFPRFPHFSGLLLRIRVKIFKTKGGRRACEAFRALA